MTRETSLEAYRKILDSLDMGLRKEVCETLLCSPGSTTSEIAQILGRPRDSISPRMKELIERELVQEGEVRECAVTKNQKITYWLTGSPECKPEKDKQKKPTTRMIQDYEARALAHYRTPNANLNYLNGVLRALRWVLGTEQATPTKEYDK